MISKEELLKRKKERTTIRVIGLFLILAGCGFMIYLASMDSPATILGILVVFAGMILELRSFCHYKYKDLNKLLAEYNKKR